MKKSDFEAGLQYASKIDPKHPLLSVASRGYNAINVKYLEKILSDLPKPKKPKKITRKKKDATLNKFNRHLNELFTARAKESNRFHICVTDDERKAISINIENVQKEIERTIKTKNYYVANGDLPKETNEKYPIPEDPIKLIKKRNNLQSNISQIKKELRSLHVERRDTKRIEVLEKRLGEKEIYLIYVKRAIKEKDL